MGFVTAQDPVMARVVAELRAGAKRTHWMWFVFPQIAGLGASAMAQRYALRSIDEAKAYLAHPVLGAPLRECAAIVAASRDAPRARQTLRGPGGRRDPRATLTKR